MKGLELFTKGAASRRLKAMDALMRAEERLGLHDKPRSEASALSAAGKVGHMAEANHASAKPKAIIAANKRETGGKRPKVNVRQLRLKL